MINIKFYLFTGQIQGVQIVGEFQDIVSSKTNPRNPSMCKDLSELITTKLHSSTPPDGVQIQYRTEAVLITENMRERTKAWRKTQQRMISESGHSANNEMCTKLDLQFLYEYCRGTIGDVDLINDLSVNASVTLPHSGTSSEYLIFPSLHLFEFPIILKFPERLVLAY